MNAERLLAHYDRVADAPDAIGRLRRFVIDLAVRGKLVEQNPADEPASELLKRIAAEKARMVKAGEIRAKKPPPNGTRDELAMSLPGGWSSAHLHQITACLDYLRKPINATERAKRIEGKSDDELFPYYGATQQQGWIDDYLFDEELVLLGEDGAPFLDPFRPKAYLIRGKAWVNNHAHVFRGILVSHPYLVHALNVFDYSGHVVGATRAKLNQKRALGIPIPLPPLSEQRRIVAKVDGLMALCDRLDETRAAREDTRDRLTKASLARLTAPDTDAAAFRGHARFAIHALPALTARPDQVKHLRQTILSLAVRGKLVEQEPADEPASELLKRIDAARKLAPTQGRKTKRVSIHSSLAETAFSPPTGWARARLSKLVRVLNGRAYRKAELLDSGTPVLRVGNLFTSKHWYYSDLQLAEDKYCDEGDLLYAWSASFGPVIWPGPRVIFHYHIWKLSLFSETDLDKQFLYYFLLQQTQEIKSAGHGISMVHMTKGKMELLSVPIPPLAEQHRIVAKVDALMALCDQLQAEVGDADGIRSRLLDSLLHESLASQEASINGAVGGSAKVWA